MPQAPAPPQLHARAPRADILPQQEVVEGDGIDHVEELLEHLLDDLWVQALVTHDAVECVQLANHFIQAVGAVTCCIGGVFPVAHRFDTGKPLDTLIFQHCRH